MTGPLCDQIVGRTGSSRLLRRLESRNLLVLPLDRTGGWYRYHHLFRELLHAELTRREPEMVTELHTRAASWYEANDVPEAAIDHAQLAGDADRVARLVLSVANPVWASGRLDTVLRWMEWFSDNGLVEHQPAVAVHGALIFALVGKPGDAERWAEAAQRTTVTGVQADGNTMEGTLAYLQGVALPRRSRSDAEGRADGARRARPDESLPPGHAPRRWASPTCSRATPTGRRALRTSGGRGHQCRGRPVRSRRPGRARHRRHREGRLAGRRRLPRGTDASCRTTRSTTTGRAPSSTPGRRGWRLHAGRLRAGPGPRTPSCCASPAAHACVADRLGPGLGAAGPRLPRARRP